jgi:hypothetical protein
MPATQRAPAEMPWAWQRSLDAVRQDVGDAPVARDAGEVPIDG